MKIITELYPDFVCDWPSVTPAILPLVAG